MQTTATGPAPAIGVPSTRGASSTVAIEIGAGVLIIIVALGAGWMFRKRRR